MKTNVFIIIFILNGVQGSSKAENFGSTSHSNKFKQDKEMTIDENQYIKNYLENSENFKDVDENKLDSFNSTRDEFDGFTDSFPTSGSSIIKSGASWTYNDQDDWKDTYPSCGDFQQSPIDIRFDSSIILRNGPCLQWTNYNRAYYPLIFTFNGHNFEVSSTFTPTMTPTISGGPLSSEYLMYSIHWHYGSTNDKGAEHTTNENSSPIEMHIVHYKKKFETILHAINSGEVDALAVVGVLFTISSNANTGITNLVNRFMAVTALGPQPNSSLPLGDLGLNFSDGYYSYSGALTTPPCYPIVRWIVLRRRLTITSQQLTAFRMISISGTSVINNYRVPQPSYEREVYFYQNCGY